MSYAPVVVAAQFVSYLRLVIFLDGDAGATVRDIMLPNVVSWFMLFGSSLIIWWGLLMQERCHFRWLVSAHSLAMRLQSDKLDRLQAKRCPIVGRPAFKAWDGAWRMLHAGALSHRECVAVDLLRLPTSGIGPGTLKRKRDDDGNVKAGQLAVRWNFRILHTS